MTETRKINSPDGWCVTQFNTIETKYQWTIQSFNLFAKKPLEELKSGIFSSVLGDGIVLKWQLKLTSAKKESKDYLSISLCRIDSLKDAKPKVKVIFMIIDSKQQVEHEMNLLDESINDKELKISHFIETNSSILKDKQNLSILCYIQIGLKPLKVFSSEENPIEFDDDNDYSSQVIKDIQTLNGNVNLSDCILTSQNKKFYVQKALLAARSSAFSYIMFKNNSAKKNIEVNKYEVHDVSLSPDILTEILNFIYTGELVNIEKSTNELLKAAHEYSLPGMKKLCEIHLGKQVTVDNAIVMLLLAINNDAVYLKQQVIDFMRIHAKSVVNSSAFKTIGSLADDVKEDIMRILLLEKK